MSSSKARFPIKVPDSSICIGSNISTLEFSWQTTLSCEVPSSSKKTPVSPSRRIRALKSLSNFVSVPTASFSLKYDAVIN